MTSGSTPEIAKQVDLLYKEIILAGTYLAPSIEVAEASKAIENTQRDVNIALINELAIIFDQLKIKRNRNIINFLNLINPIIEKYMSDNSIYMLIDKKNVFIASKDYDITNNLIELINNQIKTIEIK